MSPKKISCGMSIWRYAYANRQYGDILFRAKSPNHRFGFCQNLREHIDLDKSCSFKLTPIGKRLVPSNTKWKHESAIFAVFNVGTEEEQLKIHWDKRTVSFTGTKDHLSELVTKFLFVDAQNEAFVVGRMLGKRVRVGLWPE